MGLPPRAGRERGPAVPRMSPSGSDGRMPKKLKGKKPDHN